MFNLAIDNIPRTVVVVMVLLAGPAVVIAIAPTMGEPLLRGLELHAATLAPIWQYVWEEQLTTTRRRDFWEDDYGRWHPGGKF
jgi:hypothetical protein